MGFTSAGGVPIYLLAGQSNVVGRGNPAVELPAELVERVHQAGVQIAFDLECQDDALAHASNGWLHLTPGCQRGKFGVHFGPERGVADRLLLTGGADHVRILKFAMGSTAVVKGRNGAPEWLPDGPYVDRMIQLAKESCSTTDNGYFIAGLFWNQGNADFKVNPDDGSAALYTERIVRLVHRLRAELPHRGLPVVARQVCKGSSKGGIYGNTKQKYRKQGKNVNAALQAAFRSDPAARCLEVPEEAMLLDDFHFDGATLLRLGAEEAETMLELVAQLEEDPNNQ